MTSVHSNTIFDLKEFTLTFRPDSDNITNEVRVYGNLRIEGSFAIVTDVQETEKDVWVEASVTVIPYDLIMSIDYVRGRKLAKVIKMNTDEEDDDEAA
jgi:hypothetical protein